MGKGFKTFIIGGFILSLASAAGSSYLYKVINKERRERQALEAAQVQIRERASAVEQETSQSKEEITKLREQLKTQAAQRVEFEKKLEESKKEITELRSKLKEIEAKSAAINKAAEKIQMELNLQPAGPELAGAQTAAAVSQSGASKAVSSASAAGKTNVSQPASVIKTAQVLTVNRKFNFVVVNVGLKDNLKVGDALLVQRDSKTVGQVTIEKIYDNFSAATITKEPKDAPFKEGDKVSKA